ncbi:hypothetical protein B9Z55_026872 [Caenorhabditis nigoni]|nr:hypothetical protein B9Z55_026872 [Caenorhabditis nigoni]
MDSKLVNTPEKDPKTLILKEFRKGKPIFESYKKFCNKMGPEFLDYPEFEFWWMRFSVGNFDLDYDRRQDPKYRTIEDFPVHIFKKICGNLEDDEYKNKYWFTLRHVCKSFRTFVDSWTPPEFIKIGISICRRRITVWFDDFEISYIEKTEISSQIGFSYHPESLQRGNFRDLAIDDLTGILAVPGGYKLEKLTFSNDIDNVFAQKLFQKFENLGTKIHVDTVEIHPYEIDPVSVNNILNSFPSIKEIDIKSEDVPDEEFTDKINKITSLKNAKMVKIHNTRDDDVFWNPSTQGIFGVEWRVPGAFVAISRGIRLLAHVFG